MATVPAGPPAAALREDAPPVRPQVARRALVAGGVLAAGVVAALILGTTRSTGRR
jgi:hypothetical protein